MILNVELIESIGFFLLCQSRVRHKTMALHYRVHLMNLIKLIDNIDDEIHHPFYLGTINYQLIKPSISSHIFCKLQNFPIVYLLHRSIKNAIETSKGRA